MNSAFTSLKINTLPNLFWVSILFFISAFSGATENKTTISDFHVVYPKPQSALDPRQDYFIELLYLALEKTIDTHGDYQLERYQVDLPPSRIPVFVSQNKLINIISSPATKQLNDGMLAIKFPLLMGVQGLRIALIHDSHPDLFANFKQLHELRNLVFGQGLGWVDNFILKDAKLSVDTTAQYENLFAMLANKRVDALLRGANEVLPELERFSLVNKGLTFDKHMAIYYPLPVFFYVAKNNIPLAERILKGLQMAQKDGSFLALFNRNYADDLANLNLTNRKLFVLKNAYLPKDSEILLNDFLHPYLKSHVLADVVLQTQEQVPTTEQLKVQ
ncbi:hypothetical protein [Paraglaciecola aestuariivivens]